MRFLHSLLLATATSLPLVCLAESAPALKSAAEGKFFVGAAINARQIQGQDAKAVRILDQEINTITPENDLKWMNIHPELNRYNFKVADKYVAFGESRKYFIIGHTLMWHNQTPPWVFRGEDGKEISREALLKRLQDHIKTVVGRYRGRIHGWDVVNEAIDDKGNLRTDKPWYKILGKEGIFAAFAAAHEADPNAELYYNDYSVADPVKRAAIMELIKEIQARGLRIDGVGTQEHHLLKVPTAADIDQMFVDLSTLGIDIHITELDVSVLPRPDNYFGADVQKQQELIPELDPYRKGLPQSVEDELTSRYRELFAIYAKHAGKIKRVTFWGAHDGSSWLNGWPIRGRTDYPLVFDRKGHPKPAYHAISAELKSAK